MSVNMLDLDGIETRETNDQIFELKVQHLTDLNKKLYEENVQLEAKVSRLQSLVSKSTNSTQVPREYLQEVRAENERLKAINSELQNKNEQLQASILLNRQVEIENRKEQKIYMQRYEEKVRELRISLQMKEAAFRQLEERQEKYRGVVMPFCGKSSNRVIQEMLKYEELIQELIAERNAFEMADANDIAQVLEGKNMFQFLKGQSNSKCQKKTALSRAGSKNSAEHTYKTAKTDVRNMVGSTNIVSSKQEIVSYFETTFLRLHLELRELKKRCKDMADSLHDYRSKDKVMKNGYNLITQELEKLRVENCQLKIRLEYYWNEKKEQRSSVCLSVPKKRHPSQHSKPATATFSKLGLPETSGSISNSQGQALSSQQASTRGPSSQLSIDEHIEYGSKIKGAEQTSEDANLSPDRISSTSNQVENVKADSQTRTNNHRQQEIFLESPTRKLLQKSGMKCHESQREGSESEEQPDISLDISDVEAPQNNLRGSEGESAVKGLIEDDIF